MPSMIATVRARISSVGLTLACLAAISFAAVMTAVAADVTIDIDETTVVHRTDATFSGTNLCALWNPTMVGPATRKAASQLGLDLIRFPGGVPAHWWDWEKPFQTGESKFTAEMVWSFAQECGAKVMFQTNTCTTNPAKNLDASGKHQADWVAYAKKQGIDVAWWEIGNEPENDGPGKENLDNVMAWYNGKFTEQGTAMKAVDPRARIMGPSSTNVYFWWNQHCLEKFLVAHGNLKGDGLTDGISLHWYPEGGAGAWEQKRATAQGWYGAMDFLRKAIAPLDDRNLPIYITEWNWGGGFNTPYCRFLSNALGCADVVGMFLKTGVNGHTHFVLQGTQGWGLLGENYDPSGENNPTVTYYAIALADKLRGEVLACKGSVDEGNVMSAYATRDPHGRIEVMLINKTAKTQSVAVSFAKFKAKLKGVDVYSLAGKTANPNEESAVYNGVAAPRPQADTLPPPLTENPDAKKESEKKIDERMAADAKKADEAKLKAEEERKKADIQKAIDDKKSPYEKKKDEERRVADEKRKADKKKADDDKAKALEEKKAADAKKSEERKALDEKRKHPAGASGKDPAPATAPEPPKADPDCTYEQSLEPMSMKVIVFWP